MYLRSRPVASTESSKRLKELNLATATILPHPMIIAGEDGDKKAAQVSKKLVDMFVNAILAIRRFSLFVLNNAID